MPPRLPFNHEQTLSETSIQFEESPSYPDAGSSYSFPTASQEKFSYISSYRKKPSVASFQTTTDYSHPDPASFNSYMSSNSKKPNSPDLKADPTKDMTPAELATYHFKLAQKHLEEAQKLALAPLAPAPLIDQDPFAKPSVITPVEASSPSPRPSGSKEMLRSPLEMIFSSRARSTSKGPGSAMSPVSGGTPPNRSPEPSQSDMAAETRLIPTSQETEQLNQVVVEQAQRPTISTSPSTLQPNVPNTMPPKSPGKVRRPSQQRVMEFPLPPINSPTSPGGLSESMSPGSTSPPIQMGFTSRDTGSEQPVSYEPAPQDPPPPVIEVRTAPGLISSYSKYLLPGDEDDDFDDTVSNRSSLPPFTVASLPASLQALSAGSLPHNKPRGILKPEPMPTVEENPDRKVAPRAPAPYPRYYPSGFDLDDAQSTVSSLPPFTETPNSPPGQRFNPTPPGSHLPTYNRGNGGSSPASSQGYSDYNRSPSQPRPVTLNFRPEEYDGRYAPMGQRPRAMERDDIDYRYHQRRDYEPQYQGQYRTSKPTNSQEYMDQFRTMHRPMHDQEYLEYREPSYRGEYRDGYRPDREREREREREMGYRGEPYREREPERMDYRERDRERERADSYRGRTHLGRDEHEGRNFHEPAYPEQGLPPSSTRYYNNPYYEVIPPSHGYYAGTVRAPPMVVPQHPPTLNIHSHPLVFDHNQPHPQNNKPQPMAKPQEAYYQQQPPINTRPRANTGAPHLHPQHSSTDFGSTHPPPQTSSTPQSITSGNQVNRRPSVNWAENVTVLTPGEPPIIRPQSAASSGPSVKETGKRSLKERLGLMRISAPPVPTMPSQHVNASAVSVTPSFITTTSDSSDKADRSAVLARSMALLM